MRGFHFRLQRVLELRRAQLRMHEHSVALANRRLADTEAALAARSLERDAASARTRRALQDRALVQLAWLDRSTSEWERAVMAARAEVEAARCERDRAVALLLESRSVVEALERLRDQQERLHRRDRRRREEKAMDERHLWSMVNEQAGEDRAEGSGNK